MRAEEEYSHNDQFISIEPVPKELFEDDEFIDAQLAVYTSNTANFNVRYVRNAP